MENTNTIKHDEIIRFLFDNHGVRGEYYQFKEILRRSHP